MSRSEDHTDRRGRLRARLSGVSVSLGGSPVLHGIDFEIREGEVAFVTGPTAAGKSTFIHLLRLALPPQLGRAIVLGVDSTRLNDTKRAQAKRHIGYVAEDPALVENWTAFQNVALPLRIAGRKLADYEEDVRELLGFVGIRGAADVAAHRLSAAERRWVAIARALASKPEVILADSPMSGLAPDVARRTVRLLAEMSRVGAAVVITSQDEGVGEGLGGSRWRLRGGALSAFTHPPHADPASPEPETPSPGDTETFG